MKKIIDYVTDGNKTDNGRLVSGINCQPYSMANEMDMTKRVFGKEKGRSYFHGIISFAPGENIGPELAHSMALKLIEKTDAFRDFEVGVATHVDKDHVHTHFVVNSVSFVDGKKIQFSKKQLSQLKQVNDDIVAANGLSRTVKGKKFDGGERRELTSYDNNAYKLLKKAESKDAPSYIRDITLEVLRAKKRATSRQELCDILAENNIHMDWRDNRKHVVFTDLTRQTEGQTKCKVRLETINKYYNLQLSKEKINDGFRNGKIIEERLSGEIDERQSRAEWEQRNERKRGGAQSSHAGGSSFERRLRVAERLVRAERQASEDFERELQRVREESTRAYSFTK